MSRRFRLPLVVLLGAIVRLPFWAEALRTPVDGDTAIVGLMSRHLGQGATLWGQPYGSPLEAVLAAPFVAALGTTVAAVRIPYFLLGLALIPLAYALARALHPEAALPAAVLMACPPAYVLVMASLPAPLYPAMLVLCGLLLVLSLRLGERLGAGESPLAALAAWGTLAGLAAWTHPAAVSVIAACGVFLFLRARGRRASLAVALGAMLAVTAPLWTHVAKERGSARAVVVSRREASVADHAVAVLLRIQEPIGGLLGTHAPLIPDSAQYAVHTPPWAAASLVLVYGLSLIQAVRASRARGPVGLLLGVLTLGLLVFPFPVRSNPHSIRFLTPLFLPMVALVSWTPAARGGARRAFVVVLALACLHLVGGSRLLAEWRALDRAEPPFLLPDLTPVRRSLERRGIGRAYASYGPAYRLTYESGERLMVSEPWNERFRNYPLPYVDEVRFAKNVAWILTPGIPSDLPAPRAFEAALGSIGGGWRRTDAGPAAIFHDFVPPFGPEAAPLASAGAGGDGDPATSLGPAAGRPLALALPAPTPLSGMTILAGLAAPPLARSLDVEVSADGVAYDVVARRRRRTEREDLRWVNGHPQYAVENDVVAVALGGRTVAAVRLTPVDSLEAWSIGEVLLHPAAGATRLAPWDEWLAPGLTWEARRAALAASPRRHREDWYYRVLVAARNR